MAIIKNIMVRAVADFSELITGSRRAGDALRDMSNRMNSGLSASLGGIGAKLAALAGVYIGFDFLKNATNDAIRFDAMMETLNNRLGASSVAFNQWADTTGKAMGYSQLQIAEYGNTFSNMLYDAATDQEDLAKKTEKFLEASAIVRSKTGLAQEEVSKRMRSAMNMEADGADELGINVRATAVEQSRAFKAMAGGVKAYSDLSSGMQKAIMYQYIMDEVSRKYGDTLSNNASTQTARFTAALKDLQLHIGQAFLPIWTTVLPALTTMINWLDSAARKAAVFLRVLLGYSAEDTTKTSTNATKALDKQTTAVGKLADATKKLKGGLAGFDQINELPDPSAAAAGAGADVPTDAPVTDISNGDKTVAPKVDDGAFKKVIDFANKVKQGFKDIGEGWNNFWKGIKDHKDIIIASLAAVIAPLVVLFGPGMIAGLITFSVSFVSSMIPVIASAWSAAVAFLAVEWPIILIIAAIAALAFGLTMLVFHWKEVKEWVANVWDSVVQIWGNCIQWFKTQVLDPFLKGWNSAWGDFKKGVSDAWNSLVAVFKPAVTWMWDNVIKPYIDLWVNSAVAIGKAAVATWNAVTTVFKVAGQWFYDNVIVPVIAKFSTWATQAGAAAVTVWDAIKAVFNDAGTWFTTHVVDKIVSVFNNLKTGLATAATNAWTAIQGVFSTVTSWFTTNLIDPIKGALASLADGIGDGLVTGFKQVYNTIAGYLNNLLDIWNKVTGSNPITDGLSIGFRLPKLKSGGITNGEMVATIGDNFGGREVVSPLSDLTAMISTAVTQAMQFSQPSSGSKQGGDIVLNIDGRQFARIVKPYIDNAGSTVMINKI